MAGRPDGRSSNQTDEVTMRKRNLLMCSAVLLMCWTGTAWPMKRSAFVEGTANVGAHYSRFTDNPTRVGEYVNLDATKDLQADYVSRPLRRDGRTRSTAST